MQVRSGLPDDEKDMGGVARRSFACATFWYDAPCAERESEQMTIFMSLVIV
jgi:hypothetical protein